jgi:putative intracellular protease/amidase
MRSVVLVLTVADQVTADGTRRPIAFPAEEVIAPIRALRAAGAHVTIATPGGVPPAVDPPGPEGPEQVEDLRAELEQLASPVRLEAVSAADLDGVFVLGGQGANVDLAIPAELCRLLVTIDDEGTIVWSGSGSSDPP